MIRRMTRIVALITLPVWIWPVALGCLAVWIVTGRDIDFTIPVDEFIFGKGW